MAPSNELERELSFVHLNVNSLLADVNLKLPLHLQYSKLVEIEQKLINEGQFKIIALTETKLSNAIPDSYIDILPSYKCTGFRKDVNRHQKGILAYVHTSLHATRRQDLECIFTQMIWLEIIINRKKVLFCICYRPPGQNREEINQFLTDFYTSVNLAMSEKPYSVVIMGDINDRCVDWNGEHNVSELKNDFRDMLLQNGLYQIITEPTHFTDHSAYILDLVITDGPGYLADHGVLTHIGENAHLPVYGIINLFSHSSMTHRRTVWHYNHADVNGLNESFKNFDWNTFIHLEADVNNMAETVTNIILDKSKEFIPQRTITIRSKDKPWFTKEVHKLIKLRNRYSSIYNRTKNPVHKLLRNIFGSRVKNQMKTNMKVYLEKQKSLLSDPNLSTKKYWSVVKQIQGSKVKHNIPTLIDNGKSYTTSLEKAELLNNYFAEQSNLPPPGTNYHLPTFHYTTDSRLEHIKFTENDVSKVLETLPLNKAHGFDGISNRLLRMCNASLSKPLSVLYQLSMDNGSFPLCWKCANVSSIYKKCEDYIKSNYRPISLLVSMSKVMETSI